jgi:pyruvate/2-oxoglutarate dehydrogenase complex dihydrolipoamide acyltransferase (E2) component
MQTVVEDARTQSTSEEVEARILAKNSKGQEEDTSSGGTLASPLARVLAREFGLDITTIPATGAGGRVTAEDVRNFMAPEESVPEIDQTVDYFFADVADDLKDDGK